MTDLLDWLDAPAWSIAGVPSSWAEVLGAVTGVGCVALLARQHVATWPLGLANNLLWALLFVRARLYADGALQVVFFALGCYGWWLWLTPRAQATLRVRRATGREAWPAATATAVLTAALAMALARLTDSPAPVADALVFTLSLWATYWQAHKVVESWWLWLAVDAISVPLYVSRSLYPTAVVYAGFAALCVLGLRAWRLELAAAAAAEAP